MSAPLAPPHLVMNILDATLGPQAAKRGWRSWFPWAPAIWETRFAMGLGTVAASILIVFHATGGTPDRPKALDLNPVHMVHAVNRQAHLTYARGEKFVNDLRVVYQIESQLRPEPEIAPLPSAEPPEPPAMKQVPETKPEQESKPDSETPPSTRELDQSSPREKKEQARVAAHMILAMSRAIRKTNARSSS